VIEGRSDAELARDLDIEVRVSSGLAWYLVNVSRENRDEVDLDDLSMDDVYTDVLGLAYSEDSDKVRARLGLDDVGARLLGMLHVTAAGKESYETTEEEDDQIAREYGLLTTEWRKRFRAHQNQAPAEAFGAWMTETYGALAAVEEYTFKDMKAAFEAGIKSS